MLCYDLRLVPLLGQVFSYQGVLTVVMKNCDPLLFLPVLAIEMTNFLCFSWKFSSSKELP